MYKQSCGVIACVLNLGLTEDEMKQYPGIECEPDFKKPKRASSDPGAIKLIVDQQSF